MEQTSAVASVPVEPDTPPRHTRFLARQPILDAMQTVVAYELLFRTGRDNVFSGNGDDATRQMLDNILVVGAQWLSADTLAFFNCTRDALVGHLATLLPPAHTVLEVLEDVTADDEVVSACHKLKEMGYRFALDDFYAKPGMEPLIEIADYIKIDFRASGPEARKKIRSQVRRSRAALLAEKIETQDEFAIALDEGHQYFQGYFFSRPTILARDEVPLNHLNSIRLLAALSNSPLNHREIERLVLADAPLCFRLMRMVNSPMYAMRGQIDSVRRALVVVGENEFRKLATVAMTGSLGRQPHALISLSLQRARFCELLAPHLNQDPIEQYLMGLLSLMDAILQTPMSAIVDLLPLRPDVHSALLGEYNSAAVPLCIAKSYESGDWGACAAENELFSLGSELLNKICLDATHWADETLSAGTLHTRSQPEIR